MRRFRKMFSIGLLGVALGCGGGSSSSTQPEPAGTVAWLRVDNQTFVDLNMSVWHNNSRQRLGRSTANTSTTFRIPPAFVAGRSPIRIIADPIGRAQEAVTRDLDVIPGDTVIMVIPPS